MGPQFTWREEFNLGVDVIDKEHQRLFKIINKLFEYREAEKDAQWICQEGIKFFKNHALKHFNDEEAYMASVGYEGLERHRHVHQGFREIRFPRWSWSWSRPTMLPTRWSISSACAPVG